MPMKLVVKLTSHTGSVCWLSAPTPKALRVVVGHERAEVFETPEDAQRAIQTMPDVFVRDGAVFSVESAD
jgi:hypothetical protein